VDHDAYRPPPHRVADRKEWIVCDDPELDGFAVYVRTSVTNAEQDAIRARHDDIVGPISEAWDAIPLPERDLAQGPWSLQKRLMAPYILDWNAQGFDLGSGEWKTLPPPGGPDGIGIDALDAVPRAYASWCYDIVVSGYYVTGKAGPWLPTSAPAGTTSVASTDGADPPPVEKPKRRRGRTN
jgi:hypothetical protein